MAHWSVSALYAALKLFCRMYVHAALLRSAAIRRLSVHLSVCPLSQAQLCVMQNTNRKLAPCRKSNPLVGRPYGYRKWPKRQTPMYGNEAIAGAASEAFASWLHRRHGPLSMCMICTSPCHYSSFFPSVIHQQASDNGDG